MPEQSDDGSGAVGASGDQVHPNFFCQPPPMDLGQASFSEQADWKLGQLKRDCAAEHAVHERHALLHAVAEGITDAIYRSTKVPYLGLEGKVAGIVGIACDITQSNLLQAERDRLLERLRLQIDRLPLAHILIGADGNVVDWNPFAEKTFGYSKEEAVGRSCLELIVPRPVPKRVAAVIRRIWAGDMNAHSINENRTRDGRIITCQWFNTPLMDAAGKFTGVISLAQDITEREQAERRLRTSEERFRQLVGNIEGYFWLSSLDDGQMFYMSPRWEKITGQSCASLYLQPDSWTDLIHPEDRARVRALLQVPLRQQRHLEYRIVRPDGSIRWLHDRAFPVRNQAGQVYRIAGLERRPPVARPLPWKHCPQ